MKMLGQRVPLGLCHHATSQRGRHIQRIEQPTVLGVRKLRPLHGFLPVARSLQGQDGRDGPSEQELCQRRNLSPQRQRPSTPIHAAGSACADTAPTREQLERLLIKPEPEVLPPLPIVENGRHFVGRSSALVSTDEGPLPKRMLSSMRPHAAIADDDTAACSTSGPAPDAVRINGQPQGNTADAQSSNGHANRYANGYPHGQASVFHATVATTRSSDSGASSSSSSSGDASLSSQASISAVAQSPADGPLTSDSSTPCTVSLSSSPQSSHTTGSSEPATSHAPSSGPPPDAKSEPPAAASQPAQEASAGTESQPALPTPAGHIPQPILVISFVSATLTMASCVFNTLLPIYMVTELRMSMRSMGMFEGLLEAFSYIVRMFSGVVSDLMTSRKAAITLGFAMGAMAKFGMSGAATVGQLFASKAVDRLANGVQAAPRDALISDLAPATSRSACFGFAQSMRKWGSFMGAGLSYFLMKASGNNYKLIFLLAATVSVASCLAFAFLVPSHKRPQQAAAAPAAAPASGSATQQAAQQQQGQQQQGFSLRGFWRDVRSMGPDFYRMLAVIALYGMGHINESMLEARAIEVGFGKAESTLVVALLALAISLSAYPLGRLDDRYGPRVTFAVGMGALVAGNLTLLLSGAQPFAVFAACCFLGVHWAVIQGPLLSIVVGLAPPNLRGTAFGIFYSVMAATAVAANSLYGSLWTACGAGAAFSLSATLMTGAVLALPWLLPRSVQGRGSGQAPVPAAVAVPVTVPGGPKLAPA